MKYQIIIRPSAERELDRIPRPMRGRLLDTIMLLATNPRPRGIVKMAGYKNSWRLRVGDFRVIYEIHDERITILVLRIGHRRDVYRDV